jgi:hypothetical protein
VVTAEVGGGPLAVLDTAAARQRTCCTGMVRWVTPGNVAKLDGRYSRLKPHLDGLAKILERGQAVQ